MSLRIGSLCTGYGGLDSAVQQVIGGELAWVADNDPGAVAVLAHHHPDVPNLGDLTAVDWATVEPVHIICAGFPCTDLSYAGRGAGIVKGNRSGLWYTIADALGVLRPRLVVLENVAAIVGRRPGLDVVLADLARLGFDADWICVRASDVNAPHKRDRWFLVAWPAAEDTNRPACSERRLSTSGQTPGRWPWTDAGRRGGAPVFVPSVARGGGCNAAGDGRDERRTEPAGQQGRPDAAVGGPATPADAAGEGWEAWWEGLPRTGGEWGPYEPSIRRWEGILGRPAPHPTERAPKGGQRLSPVFVEWMMGLPAGWVTDVPGLTRNQQLKLLGNGVVPQQGAHALRLLFETVRREVAA